MIGVKVTVECGDCGSRTVFTEPDMYTLLEETVFYADCMRYDEDNEYKEYCVVNRHVLSGARAKLKNKDKK